MINFKTKPSKYLKQLIIHLCHTFGLNISRLIPTGLHTKHTQKLLAPLDPHFRSDLLSMYRGEPQLGTDGKIHPIDNVTMVSPSFGMWLYNFCLTVKPKSTLEIGMAYGYSTLYFLAAINRNKTGHHTAIDPYQSSSWHGIGFAHANARATSISDFVFRFIEDRSDRVATDLARSNSNFDIIFIDGNHRFDDVLVDFYLYAPLCVIGGHIIFDDFWLSSVKTVVAFIQANRTDFVKIPAAYPYCVFEKVSDDLRHWYHFRKFAVYSNTSKKK